SSLNVSESIDLLGGLVVTNNSTSLLAANVGDIIPLAQASTLVGNFDSIVFPLMPEGLGLQLIDYPALRGGGSEVAAEVIEVEGAEFANPFTGDLDSPPVDIISFDADGDGRDEMAVLFEGTPGGVVGYSVSQDGLPTPIDGLVVNVGNNPVSIDAADINSDGREDLIVANSTDNSISVLLTMVDIDGSLYFDVFAISVPGSGQSITCVAAIDLDGDTDLDAVVGVDGVNTGYQVLLDLSGAMTNGSWFAIPDYQLPDDTYVPDPPTCVDGGDQTSAWGFVGGTRYGRIHRGTSSGALQVIDELEGNNTVTIEAIELDEGGGDGQIDLMVSSDEAESIYLFKGNAAESDGFDNLIPLGVSSSVEDLVALDVDDDGDMDMVMTAPTSDTPLVLLRNDGGGIELVGGLSGITWSKQAVDSGNPPRNVSSGTLGGKDEDDDWIVGAGGNAGLIGTETSTLSQINIASNSSCPCDLNSDGAVSVNDLLLLIADWGACSNCEADFDNNNAVDVLDLLVLIAAWGPCS
ncbi:MAG: FG-GAP-like repeat-containing protein, partial [Phycisphaerales bacterium]